MGESCVCPLSVHKELPATNAVRMERGRRWGAVLICRYDFDQNEVVLALESVKLESDSMPGGFRDFVAVGTGFDFAEDRATRGNVSLFCSSPSPLRPSERLHHQYRC